MREWVDADGMIRRLSTSAPLLGTPLLGVLLLATAPAGAAERSYTISSFDRIRVEGPFDVQLATESSPGARAEGEPRATDGIDIRIEGTTLIIRAGVNGWGEQPVAGSKSAPLIRVSTPMIRSATIIGGGRLVVAGPVRGQRVDLALTGSGSLAVPGLDVDILNAALLGSGNISLGGRGAKVRLTTNGSGSIDAVPLRADDLTIRSDGTGEMRATARYTASVTTTGIGGATVYGSAACTVNAVAGGPISCGKLPPP